VIRAYVLRRQGNPPGPSPKDSPPRDALERWADVPRRDGVSPIAYSVEASESVICRAVDRGCATVRSFGAIVERRSDLMANASMPTMPATMAVARIALRINKLVISFSVPQGDVGVGESLLAGGMKTTPRFMRSHLHARVHHTMLQSLRALLFRWLSALTDLQDPCPRFADEGRGVLAVCPDDLVQELAEVVRSFLGVELQLDDHVVAIVHWPADPMTHDTGAPARVGEPVEGLLPGGKIVDGVLDAEGEHCGLRFGV